MSYVSPEPHKLTLSKSNMKMVTRSWRKHSSTFKVFWILSYLQLYRALQKIGRHGVFSSAAYTFPRTLFSIKRQTPP
jgi:hypothetical protein